MGLDQANTAAISAAIAPLSPCDILILSNGPGEISTWVRPVVRSLREHLPDHSQARLSVVLSPCANASGREAEMACQLPGVDRVQGPEHFFSFLVTGKTAKNWDWHPRGVVLFLGGDQIYPVVVGRRLGYRTVIYAEWDARWHSWIDRFGCMTANIVEAAPREFRYKCEVVGDLMADVQGEAVNREAVNDSQGLALGGQRLSLNSDHDLIGLMPGSKKNKLSVGLPFALGTAEAIHRLRPNTQFVLPVAPMLSLEALAQFADAAQNPDIQLIEGAATAELVEPNSPLPRLRTPSGLEVLLWQTSPAYDVMSQMQFCLTTVGANTAELGSLGVPMMVLLPTQKLEAMKAWDGIPGLLANLPLVGDSLAKIINRLVLRQIYKEGKLFAWPNIWAKREIVPERLGPLKPQDVAAQVVDYLESPSALEVMRQELRSVRGEAGAAAKLAAMVVKELRS
ncbi:lipid-A-disaccharide synthase [Nodosilinea sp. LEGE 07298]|uniref:lipid-A-disaccharide synthase n=1 Tax=Nodosilinea sp. LEGE 07298 TaxID=2777970 RepID=UPI00188288B9|nr:lipid-A-disaccharide synthase [Nodosilinea sp. LEGE 07298]MBE9113058.1 lipid-A-disaccharide synthase [Nodosilinea sp. LEGE 07298]